MPDLVCDPKVHAEGRLCGRGNLCPCFIACKIQIFSFWQKGLIKKCFGYKEEIFLLPWWPFHTWCPFHVGCVCSTPVLGGGCWFPVNFPLFFHFISLLCWRGRERSCCLSAWPCKEPFAACMRYQLPSGSHLLLLAVVWQTSPTAAFTDIAKSKARGEISCWVLSYGTLKIHPLVLRLGNVWAHMTVAMWDGARGEIQRFFIWFLSDPSSMQRGMFCSFG